MQKNGTARLSRKVRKVEPNGFEMTSLVIPISTIVSDTVRNSGMGLHSYPDMNLVQRSD
jgi:hypothetical protein